MKKLSHAIMYLSDLYVMVMVLGWVGGIILLSVCAVYAMLTYQDTSLFSNLTELITVPATAGGALWMIRCCVNHAKAEVEPDFPNVEPDQGVIEETIPADDVPADAKGER